MPQISVIIPIYNGAKFVSDTVESVLVQSFNDFELILINDGSKDNSADICKSYASKDKRVKYLEQKNAGASMARLTAIKSAESDWITFVDQDDLLEDFALETFYAAIAEDVDLIISDCNVQIEDSIHYIKSILTSKIPVTNWGKLIRKDLLKEFLFEDARNIRLGDDVIINFRLGMLNPNMKIKSIPDILYKYNLGLNNESMSNAFIRTEKYEGLFYSTLINGFSANELKVFMNQLIQIRVNAIKYIIVDNGYKLDTNSDFVVNLKNDIKAHQYKLNFVEYCSLHNMLIFRLIVLIHRIIGNVRRRIGFD